MFFSRQPLKTAAKDFLQKKSFPRTRYALGFGGLFLALALVALGFGVRLSVQSLLLPLAALAVLAGIQFGFDAFGKGRNTLPELAGAFAAATFAPLTAEAGGLAPETSWYLAAVLALHSALAIVYVSTRLDVSRNLEASVNSAYVAAGLVALVTIVATALYLVPALLIPTFLVLIARAVWGVSAWRRPVKPQIVGIQEMLYTLGLVGISVFAFRAGP